MSCVLMFDIRGTSLSSLFLEASSFPDYGHFGAAACGEVTGFWRKKGKEVYGRGWVAIQVGFWMVIMLPIKLWQTAFKRLILVPQSYRSSKFICTVNFCPNGAGISKSDTRFTQPTPSSEFCFE